MTMSDLYIKVTYPINEPGKFKVETNAKAKVVSDLIVEFLHSQVGAGVDESKANEVDVYEITLTIDLSCDAFGTRHNCGNLGLRDGILMDVVKQIDKSENLDWLVQPQVAEEVERLSEL
jgi:hypothetical protein